MRKWLIKEINGVFGLVVVKCGGRIWNWLDLGEESWGEKNEAWEFSRGPGKFLGRVGEGFLW